MAVTLASLNYIIKHTSLYYYIISKLCNNNNFTKKIHVPRELIGEVEVQFEFL